ncbi:MAG: relaxase/mobilization nuclease domain-containing protein [Bacteroidota bacterium]
MVAKIESGKSMRGILHYNEDKVLSGEAQLIFASGFAGDIEKMNLTQKLIRFKHLTELNGKVKTNALHITLNFDASEKPRIWKLQQIASEYMDRIGFGDQPFLVYSHLDAHHPHVHIATTNIQKNGERIDIHGIGYRLSEPARKDLEIKYDLVRAEGREISQGQNIRPAIYGEKPTKQVISNTVTGVMRQYSYTSFAEYKAILERFNIRADRGAVDTRMFENRGLLYSILDGKGEAVGVPIKASQIYCKPTMHELEKRFERNMEKRKPFKADLKGELDKLFFKFGNLSQATLEKELRKNSIDVIFRRNENGQLYGVTYIDHRNKNIFKGSDLGNGKAYSAKAMSERFEKAAHYVQKAAVTKSKQPGHERPEHHEKQPKTYLKTPALTNFLDIALAQTQQEDGVKLPKRKKKRRKGEVMEQDQQLTL